MIDKNLDGTIYAGAIPYITIELNRNVKGPVTKTTITSTQARGYFIGVARTILTTGHEPFPGDKLKDYKNFMRVGKDDGLTEKSISHNNAINLEIHKEFLSTFPQLPRPFRSKISSIVKYTDIENELPNFLYNIKNRVEPTHDAKEVMEDMDDIFRLLRPIENETVLYRGLSLGSFFEITKHFWYTSASTSKYVAMSPRFSNGVCCLLIITIPPGSKVLYLNDKVTVHPEEQEVIIDKDGSFIITYIEPGSVRYLKTGDTCVPDRIYMTYLPPRVKGPKFLMDKDADELIQIRDKVVTMYMKEYKQDDPVTVKKINTIFIRLKQIQDYQETEALFMGKKRKQEEIENPKKSGN